MGLDLQFEEAITADEITTMLKISEEDLNEMEGQGLPFIQAGEHHLYLTSSILGFFKRGETTVRKEEEAR